MLKMIDLCSIGIASVLEKLHEKETLSSISDGIFTAFQMLGMSVQNQISRNQTKEQIITYLSQVIRVCCLL